MNNIGYLNLDEIPQSNLDINQSNLLKFSEIYHHPEVVIYQIYSRESAISAIQSLREGKAVILNLAWLNSDEIQRAVDFLAGATHAIDGQTVWLGKKTLLFVPICFQVKSSRPCPAHFAPKLE
jgi:cell division inhibitor SepF